ncbi:MAG: PrsW family glutamic-type intramembrane protease [Gemmatimonadales bacterium]
MDAGAPDSSSRPRLSGAHSATLFFSCVAGPDRGKRLALAPGRFVFGSATDCNLLSDDPAVAPHHGVLLVEAGRLAIEPDGEQAVFLDGHRVEGSTLVTAAQQVRLGRSTWRLGEPDSAAVGEAGFAGFIDRLGARVSSVAGLERIHGFSPGAMFSEVFRRRTADENEEYFTVGTRTTTPALAQIETDWPKPWAFARTLGAAALAYGMLVYGFREFTNPYFIPGIIVLGSIAIPLAILMFFFEVNVPRNISLYQIIRMMVFGGIISLIVSLFGFRWTGLSNWLGAMSAGIVEEAGKAVTLLLFVRNPRYRWTLNGLLIGAAVGTGFSVFETMGYALNTLRIAGEGAMLDIITYRGWLNILGDHALWTGLVGAALWRVRGDRPFDPAMLRDPRFLRVLAIAAVLHMVNNLPVALPFYLKYLAIGFVAWAAILSFIQDGLLQVRREQLAEARPTEPPLPS